MIHVLDFEVTRYDWLVVIASPLTQEERVIVNNPDELTQFYQEHKNDIFIGYNIREYDAYIFKAILAGFDPYEISNFIVNHKNKGYEFSNVLKEYPLNTFDLIQLNTSLKQLEGFQGHAIYESDVPFDIDRELTPDELHEMIIYCKNDVQETMNLFLMFKSDFDSQIELINEFKLPLSYISRTQTQLTATILKAERYKCEDEFNLTFPAYLDRIKKYKYIVDWYKDPENRDYKKSLKADVAGVPHIFAWGGLHGAIPKYHGEGYYLHIDVNSYYPSLMITHDYFSRAVPAEGKERFKRMYHENLSLKKQIKTAPESEKEYLKRKRTAYKLICNKTYGGFKDKYNPLYDPLMSNNVTVTGQLALLLLIEMLEPHVHLIQSNTDGLIIKLSSLDDYELVDDIAYEWEKLTGVKLGFDSVITKIFQKDVNNYLFVDCEGNIESKGAYVKSLSPTDNDLPILNKALKEYMVNNTPIEETINRADDVIDFQKIVKLSSSYKYVMHNNEIYTNKCYRVFASKDPCDGIIYKCKSHDKRDKFANTPERCLIENGDVTGIKVPAVLDREWYIQEAYKRLDQFGVENE